MDKWGFLLCVQPHAIANCMYLVVKLITHWPVPHVVGSTMLLRGADITKIPQDQHQQCGGKEHIQRKLPLQCYCIPLTTNTIFQWVVDVWP